MWPQNKKLAAQILPSLGPRESAKKILSILSIKTWVTGSQSPFKWGTKTFRRLRHQPISPYWLYDGRDLSNILAPERGGGGQGLHLGTPRGESSNIPPANPPPPSPTPALIRASSLHPTTPLRRTPSDLFRRDLIFLVQMRIDPHDRPVLDAAPRVPQLPPAQRRRNHSCGSLPPNAQTTAPQVIAAPVRHRPNASCLRPGPPQFGDPALKIGKTPPPPPNSTPNLHYPHSTTATAPPPLHRVHFVQAKLNGQKLTEPTPTVA